MEAEVSGMLVLSRRETQRVIIANRICVEVVRIGSENVRLGFNAPMHIAIRRGEVQGKFGESDADAANTQIPSEKMLRLLAQLHDMAQTRGTTSEHLFEEIIRRFQMNQAGSINSILLPNGSQT